MLEIETKFLDIDRDAIVAKLEQLGAVKEYDGMIRAYYYDFPDRRIRDSGKSLRLRIKDDAGIIGLTAKTKLSANGVRICNEQELQLPAILTDFVQADLVLLEVGLQRYRNIAKTRTTYVHGTTRFEIDTIMHPATIPTLLEIEDISAEAVTRAAKLLHLSMRDAKPWSTRRTLKHYKKMQDAR